MKILPITNFRPTFKSEIGGWDDKPSSTSLLRSFSNDIGSDKYHPFYIKVDFHKNGKISNINIQYANGKFAAGEINESYDENGKNINYEA